MTTVRRCGQYVSAQSQRRSRQQHSRKIQTTGARQCPKPHQHKQIDRKLEVSINCLGQQIRFELSIGLWHRKSRGAQSSSASEPFVQISRFGLKDSSSIVRQVPSRREGFRASFLHRKSHRLCACRWVGGTASGETVQLRLLESIQVRHRSHATYSRQPRQVRKEATVTGSCVCSGPPVPGLFFDHRQV